MRTDYKGENKKSAFHVFRDPQIFIFLRNFFTDLN